MEIVEILDLSEAVLGRSLLAAATLCLLLLALWGCGLVLVAAIADLQSRLKP